MNGEQASRFLLRLLERRKRRLPILYAWNMKSAPCNGETLQEVLHAFVSTLLYAPLDWCMTHEALYPWGMHRQGMGIPYEWLDPKERRTVLAIHQNRDALFRKEEHHPIQQTRFTLRHYMHPLVLSGQHRRELLRDFIGLCSVQQNEVAKALVYRELLAVVQNLIVAPKNGRVDPFLMPIMRHLHGWCGVQHMTVIDPSVERAAA